VVDAKPAPRGTGKRELILKTFVRHVAERGYDGTNLGDLAAELEISKGTIVHHFTSKDRMLAEAHERYMHYRVNELKLIATALRTPGERLAGIVYATVLYQHHDRAGAVAFQREATRFRDDDVMAAVRGLRAEFMSTVVDVVKDGVADGSFREVDPAIAAMGMLSFGFWAWTWYVPDDERPPEQVAQQLVQLYLSGLLDPTNTAGVGVLDEHVGAVVRGVLDAVGGGG